MSLIFTLLLHSEVMSMNVVLCDYTRLQFISFRHRMRLSVTEPMTRWLVGTSTPVEILYSIISVKKTDENAHSVELQIHADSEGKVAQDDITL